MKNAVVVGAGTMGHGIAQVMAMYGLKVKLLDIKKDILEKALGQIKSSLAKLEDKGRIEDSSVVMDRISTAVYDTEENIKPFKNSLKDVDIALEAVFENLNVKKKIFELLDRFTPEDTILASNTSSLPITEIAEVTEKKPKTIGMHFFNPPQFLKLVEIVKGKNTSKKTVEKTKKLAEKLDKTSILVKRDVPGFVVNRILIRLLNEACLTLKREKTSKVAIDATLKYEAKIPMGAFELLDYSGIDVFYDLAKAMKKRGFNIKIADTLKEKAEAEKYGQKTGEGFYNYEGGRPKIPENKASKANYVSLFAPAVNEAAWIVRNNVATEKDVNTATKLGLNYPQGILEMAKEWGMDKVLGVLKRKAKRYGSVYSPDPYLEKLKGDTR